VPELVISLFALFSEIVFVVYNSI